MEGLGTSSHRGTIRSDCRHIERERSRRAVVHLELPDDLVSYSEMASINTNRFRHEHFCMILFVPMAYAGEFEKGMTVLRN